MVLDISVYLNYEKRDSGSILKKLEPCIMIRTENSVEVLNSEVQIKELQLFDEIKNELQLKIDEINKRLKL